MPNNTYDYTKEYDYTEDFADENGEYMHVCLECQTLFLGHKRRVICKTCANNIMRRHNG